MTLALSTSPHVIGAERSHPALAMSRRERIALRSLSWAVLPVKVLGLGVLLLTLLGALVLARLVLLVMTRRTPAAPGLPAERSSDGW